MKLLAAMAIVATTLGVISDGEVWDTQPDSPAPTIAAAIVAAPAEIPACVTIELTREPSWATNDHGIRTFSQGIRPEPFTEWEYTGDWEGRTFQADVVGYYLNYAFDQRGVDYYDMDLFDVNVSELEVVTVCRPD